MADRHLARLTDEELLRSARSPDADAQARRSAVAELLRRYETLIDTRVAHGLWGASYSRDEIDDCRQLVKMRLILEVDSGKELPRPFERAVRARCDYTMRDFRRAHQREPIPGGIDIEDDADGSDDPLETISADELLRVLSEADQYIARQCWLLGRASRDVADELGLTEGNVNVRKHRIAKRLKDTVRRG